MGVPKRKVSKSNKGKRRTHWKAKVPSVALCPSCRQPKLSHRVCPNCGYYKNRTVISTEA